MGSVATRFEIPRAIARRSSHVLVEDPAHPEPALARTIVQIAEFEVAALRGGRRGAHAPTKEGGAPRGHGSRAVSLRRADECGHGELDAEA